MQWRTTSEQYPKNHLHQNSSRNKNALEIDITGIFQDSCPLNLH